MNTTKKSQGPSTEPDQIEGEIAKHRAELGRTIDVLRERLDVKKQAKRQWGRVRQRVVNSAAVAVDDARLAMARAQYAPPRKVAAILGSALGLVGVIVLLVIAVRRRKP